MSTSSQFLYYQFWKVSEESKGKWEYMGVWVKTMAGHVKED